MDVAQFAIGCLATYRLTLLLVEDRGPFGVLERARQRVAAFHGELAQLLACTWCVSFWVGLVAMLPVARTDVWAYLLAALGASGFTVLMEVATGRG